MSNDKTLATVKHGGCVQLGDGLQLANEWRHVFDGNGHDMAGANKNTIRRFIQAIDALSAQPSPGGQDALKALDDLAAFCSDDTATVGRHVAVIRAALAARQPVGEPAIDYEDLLDQAKDLIHCGCSVNGAFDWLLEQLTDGEALAAPPAQAVDDRFPNGLSDAIEYANEMEEAASALYEKVFGHEDDGEDCGTVVMRRVLHHLTEQPAQAVDPGRIRDLARSWIVEAGGTAAETKDACADELLALIDSQAVGNG